MTRDASSETGMWSSAGGERELSAGNREGARETRALGRPGLGRELLPHATERGLCGVERLDARGLDRVEALGLAAALGGRVAEPRADQPLLLEPPHRHVHGPERQAFSAALL